MFKREVEAELKGLAKSHPVVTVIGPRQSGKTTLVKHVFSNKPYVNLEAPDTRELAENDPRGFLEEYPQGAILDEIQRVPKLLSYIQTIVDESEEKGCSFSREVISWSSIKRSPNRSRGEPLFSLYCR